MNPNKKKSLLIWCLFQTVSLTSSKKEENSLSEEKLRQREEGGQNTSKSLKKWTKYFDLSLTRDFYWIFIHRYINVPENLTSKQPKLSNEECSFAFLGKISYNDQSPKQ